VNACEGSGAVAPLRRWCGERGWTATKLMLTDCRLTDMLTETWERVRLMTAVVPTAHSVPTFPRSVMCMTVVPLGSLYRSGTRNRAGGENLQPHHRAFRGRQREKYKSETHRTQRNAVTGSRLPYSLLGLRSRTIPRIPESGVDFLYLPICLPGDFCVAACARPPQRATARLGQLGTAWSVTNLSEAQANLQISLKALLSSFGSSCKLILQHGRSSLGLLEGRGCKFL